MASATSKVVKMPRLRLASKMHIPRVYVEIDGENTGVHYGLDGVSRHDAQRLLMATLELAKWLGEVANGER